MRQRQGTGARALERIARRCTRAQDPLELLEHVAEIVREQVPYVAAGWILIDPDTMLITGVYGEDVDRDDHLQLISPELTEPDVNTFWDLAARGIAAASLSSATHGDLARSTRWSRLYGPKGYGDELRAVFSSGAVAWGHACLTRAAGEPFFSAAEVAFVASIAPYVANGIRACHLLAEAAEATASPEEASEPALVMLADDGAVVSMTPRARAWLGDPEDPQLATTVVLHEVARQARALADGSGAGPPALARTRARTGEWIVVRGIRVPAPNGDAQAADEGGAGGTTALVLEQARRADLAPMLLALHRLTDREREVTQRLLHGTPTAEIARELWISTETLRGHVKAVYAKLGVSSRPELAALLSHEPRLRERSAEPAARRSR
ncbi:LuxR C-terminal-related transcriptional regulator [Agrococcus sp. Ld7]|uniref:helix-turn-helix transcriptional regulator n=1 Tax=Agrococcus sp. Ld7 TaxID=649148 RepID=UPI0038679629